MPATKPEARRDLAVEELDGEVVVYDPFDGKIHHLNPSASLVFMMLDGDTTVKEMAGSIAEAFDQEPDSVTKQVQALIRELRKAQLIEGSLRATKGVKTADG